MTTKHKLLNPLPIEFDEETHRYIWKPTNEIMANSVTSITGFDMPESKRKSIEQFKHIWAPRGTAVHKALECYLLDKQVPEQPKYDDWVVPLLTHQYFQEFFKPLAVEYRVVDLKNSIGGTLDAYGIDTRTNKKVLIPRPYISKGKTYPGILTSLSSRLLLNFTSPGLKIAVHGIKSSHSISFGEE